MGVGSFFKGVPERVVAILCESEAASVEDESRVDFLETALEDDSEDVDEDAAYGLGAEAKFLNDGSDMRGDFHGNRRITIQLILASL